MVMIRLILKVVGFIIIGLECFCNGFGGFGEDECKNQYPKYDVQDMEHSQFYFPAIPEIEYAHI
jgi:hypothetical protein